MTDPETLNRYYVGTAEAIEAEYGATTLEPFPFVVLHTWNGEGVTVEGFTTLAAAKAAYSDVPRSQIEYLL